MTARAGSASSPARRLAMLAVAVVAAGVAAAGTGCSGVSAGDAAPAAGPVLPAAGQLRPAADARRSGLDFAGAETQAMQRDDTLNPGMLWVADGAALWSQPAGGPADRGAAESRSCASCHDEAATTMRGVAARYPRIDERTGRPITLSQRIAACRTEHQHAAPFAAGGQPLLALETFVAHQSRSLPVAPDADPRLVPWRERGERLYRQRIGQLDLSCAQCHDERAGGKLGGAVIPQAHPTGYPLYRLEWQGVGSLQRRLRGCMTGVRAEPFAADAPEWVALELYLNARAAGMAVETPGVRP